MSCRLRIFLLVWLIALAGSGEETKPTTIAVYPIRAVGEVSPSLGPTLTSLLGYELNQSQKLMVVDESMLKAVMERQALNISDACDDATCQVEIGKLVQAQKMVVGELNRLGQNYFLTLKVIDVQSGTLETTTKDKCACTEDQLEQLVAAAGARIRSHFGEVIPGSQATPSSAQASSPAPGEMTASAENFFRAVRGGNLEKIQTLLTQNPSLVNAQDEKGNTALHLASGEGYPEIVKFLIAKGANVNARSNQIVGGKKNKAGEQTPLFSCAVNGHKEVCEILIAGGADVNAKGASGHTPLDMASVTGNQEVVDLLRQHGGKGNDRLLKMQERGLPGMPRKP